MNDAYMTPSLWEFAIHSNNSEIIHLNELFELEKSPLQLAIEKGNLDIFKSIFSNKNIHLNDISNLCYVHKKRYAYQKT